MEINPDQQKRSMGHELFKNVKEVFSGPLFATVAFLGSNELQNINVLAGILATLLTCVLLLVNIVIRIRREIRIQEEHDAKLAIHYATDESQHPFSD